jgi:hypothetical protein
MTTSARRARSTARCSPTSSARFVATLTGQAHSITVDDIRERIFQYWGNVDGDLAAQLRVLFPRTWCRSADPSRTNRGGKLARSGPDGRALRNDGLEGQFTLRSHPLAQHGADSARHVNRPIEEPLRL